jgi:mersacidin/lichenicidin family type 2 lantibiotic
MKKPTQEEIVRAWRDQDYYLQLSEEQRAALPAHPAGLVTLSASELEGVYGGYADAGTHYSHCDPTADWCDDCKGASL